MDFFVKFPQGRYFSANPDLAATATKSVKRNSLQLEVVPGKKTASFFASAQKYFKQWFCRRGGAGLEQTSFDPGFKPGETRWWIVRKGVPIDNISPRPFITKARRADGQAPSPHFPLVHGILGEQAAPPKPPGPPLEVVDIYADERDIPADSADHSGAGPEADPTAKWGFEDTLKLFKTASGPE
jgi:hypothetical protein